MENLIGRRKIFTVIEDITKDNVIDVVNSCLSTFFANKDEIEYLYNYRKGIQPILERTKEIRKDICNKIVVNTADQIVTFKNGYFLTQPAFYIARTVAEDKPKKKTADVTPIMPDGTNVEADVEESENDKLTRKVAKLNDYLYTSGKQQADNEIVNWFHTVGIGVAYIEPSKDDNKRKPVNVYSVDPRQCFVAYSLNPGNRPVFGCNVVMLNDKEMAIDCYTREKVFRLRGNVIKSPDDHTSDMSCMASKVIDENVNVIGEVPFIEYYMNNNRMSAFESVIPLLNAYNVIESNRADGVEQFIQSLCVATNCQFDEGVTANTIRESGMICLKSTDGNRSDFKILSEQLDQSQTQTTLDNLLNRIYAITGIPYSGGNTGSTSDNVGAVYMRNGFSTAETFARDTEDCFKCANKYFDIAFIKTLKLSKVNVGLDVEDLDLQFTRSEVENLLTKTQGALNLKQLGLSPEIILAKAGISNDPAGDVQKSKEYIDAAFTTLDELTSAGSGLTEGIGEPISMDGLDGDEPESTDEVSDENV